MFEKIGDVPPTDKELLDLISGLASDPEKLKDEKSIENLNPVLLEDISKAIRAKRPEEEEISKAIKAKRGGEKCFNEEIDDLLKNELDKTQKELMKEKKRFKDQQKREAQEVIKFTDKGQEAEIDLEEADKVAIRDEIF